MYTEALFVIEKKKGNNQIFFNAKLAKSINGYIHRGEIYIVTMI